MYYKNEIKFFRKALLSWFDINKRDFPWRRETASNYELIISEILLQRTKAETVADYYDVFFGKYPNWDELIKATDKELAKILKPLGLNAHRTARLRKIIDEYKEKQGILPKDTNELRESSFSSLYLSNAFELFILNKKGALIDVNMVRVIRRYFYPRQLVELRKDTELHNIARDIVNIKQCKEINWAVLDFAALVCKENKPECANCVLNAHCCFNDITNETAVNDVQANMYYDSEQKLDPIKPLKVLSLFSGCGGMDLGFEGNFIVNSNSINPTANLDFISETLPNDMVRLQPTKFQLVFANDISKGARNAWVNYFGKRGYSPGIFHTESIVDIVKQHKAKELFLPEKVDILTGGFPCQDFSLAGKRNGFQSHKDHLGNIIEANEPSIETRGQLYMWMKKMIEITLPNIFIAENVKGLMNMSNVKEIIQRDFSAIDNYGYIVLDPMVLQAANYGVPQSRERVIFIGIKKSALKPAILKELSKEKVKKSLNPYPEPSHSYSVIGKTLKEPVTLNAIFKNLLEPDRTNDLSQKFYSRAKYMGKHCQGQAEVNLDGVGPTIRSEHHGNIEFRRLSEEHGGKHVEELQKFNYKERRLTPRECALIQTFPPDYEFIVPNANGFDISPSVAYKLIGNAVPPLLAYHIAKRIESLWDVYFKLV